MKEGADDTYCTSLLSIFLCYLVNRLTFCILRLVICSWTAAEEKLIESDEMELDRVESDPWRRWSPTTSPGGDWNRSHRDKSRTCGSKHGPEIWDSRSKRGMDESASPGKGFVAEDSSNSEHTCLPVKHELEQGEHELGKGEIPNESKRRRHSDHQSKENFTDSLEERNYSCDRHPRRHGTDDSGEEKPELFENSMLSHYDSLKGRCQRESAFRFAKHVVSFNGGRFIKDELSERIYHRRDPDESFGLSEPHQDTSVPCKYFGEGRCQQVGSYGSSPKGMLPDLHSCYCKHGYDVECDNGLSRYGAWSKNRATTNEARRCKWRSNDDIWGYRMKHSNNLKETTSRDATNSIKWKSQNVRSAHITETDNTLLWNGPKWGEETTYARATSKDAANTSEWRSDVDKWAPGVKIGDSLSCTGPKWGDETNAKDVPSSWRSSTDKWDSWETNSSSSRNGPKWDDRAAVHRETNAKDAPNSWRSSANKLDSWESNRSSSRNGPTQDDIAAIHHETNAKYAPSSWRSSAKKWDHWETNNSSRNGPKRDDRADPETNSKDAQNSWRPTANKWDPWETNHSPSREGTKWDDRAAVHHEKNAKYAPSSWRSSANKWASWESNNNSSRNVPKRDDRAAIHHETNAKDEPSSWRSSANKWDPWETNNSASWNGPKWDDRATTKDAPSSSRWRSDIDEWGSNVKTGNRSSWDGSKWGDETTPNDAPNSCRGRTNGDRKSYNVETDNGLTWKSPKRSDQTTTKGIPKSSARNGPWSHNRATANEASRSSKWRYDDRWGYHMEHCNNSLSWNGPKWGEVTTSKDAPNSTKKKSDNVSWDHNTGTDNTLSWNGPKWGEETASKNAPTFSNWRSDVVNHACNKEADISLPWNGPKWGEVTNTKGAPNCSQWRSIAGNVGPKVNTDNCLSCTGPKSGEGTDANNVETGKASWDGPKCDDRITAKDAPKSSRWSSDGDKGDCSVKLIYSFSQDSPKWGDRADTQDFPNSSQHRSDGEEMRHDMKANSIVSQNGAKWDDQTICVVQSVTMDAPKSDQWMPDAGKKGYLVETDNIPVLNGPKSSTQAIAVASKCPRWRLDSNEEGYDIETDDKISESVPKGAFESTLEDVLSYSHRRSDNTGSRTSTAHFTGTRGSTHKTYPSLKNPEQNSPQEAIQRASFTHEQIVTQEVSGKEQLIPKVSQSPSSKLNCLEQNGEDKKNLSIDEQNQVPPPCEAQNQQMVHSVATNGQDAMLHAPLNGEVLQANWHRHQVGNSKQLSQLSTTVKPFTDEASSATAAVPIPPTLMSQSTESITAGSNHLKHPTVVRESQTFSKSLAPSSGPRAPSSDRDMNGSTNVEGNLHHGEQGTRQGELMGGAVMEAIETQNRQSKKVQYFSHPSVADSDMRKIAEVNKDNEKGIQMFKLAIVKFVKNILTPSWKEGHLSKEAYKIIVKKVVDKVVGTLQRTDIPQTQRNIDHYVSYSETKLTNLVQAYLDRYAKS